MKYKHKKQSGGAGQYGEVHLLIEPYQEGKAMPDDIKVRKVEEHELPWGGKLVFQNCIVGGVIDNRFMPAILKGVMEKMEHGPMSGCRARDIRVSVYDGSMHSIDSMKQHSRQRQEWHLKMLLDANPPFRAYI